MGNISDNIEKFILDTFIDDMSSISRNDLADYFNVSPSQINYVLSTRFTYARGYDTESRRGGGGYIKIYKVKESTDKYLENILNNELENSVSYTKSLHIIESVSDRLKLTDREIDLMKSAISPKSLRSPIDIDDSLRAKILKNMIISLVK